MALSGRSDNPSLRRPPFDGLGRFPQMLAMTLLGFTFSGREVLIVGGVIVVVALAAWYFLLRQR